jgi:hypothetical protein
MYFTQIYSNIMPMKKDSLFNSYFPLATVFIVMLVKSQFLKCVSLFFFTPARVFMMWHLKHRDKYLLPLLTNLFTHLETFFWR